MELVRTKHALPRMPLNRRKTVVAGPLGFRWLSLTAHEELPCLGRGSVFS